MYFEKMLPLEQKYLYDELITPSLRRGDFDAKPMVLLLGQFSTGKTSFVRYLTKKNYPGIRIGPEPTTDKFIAIMYGEDERIIPGNALSLDLDKPFTFASNLGNGFLTKFEASFTPSEILKTLTFIDTPGILSGEKQRLREYDFPECAKWFANNSDMIILIFDGFKLDISDEVKEVIKALHGNSHKIKLVLNKADQLTSQQLLKVYGSLMWSLGKIIDTPENIRVYIGSFWEQPYKNSENEKFFISEERELIEDLHNLPKNSILRKISELVKRAKFLKSHIFTLEFLRNQIPTFGREKKQQQLCENIRDVFEEISKIRKFPITDFPSPSCYGKSLWEKDWNRMPPLNERVVQLLDEILTRDLPNFMSMVSPELMDVNLNEIDNPFDETDNLEWTIPQEFRDQMRRIWNDLSPNGEPLGGGQLKNKMMETGATRDQLKLIWKLVDLDKTGKLDEDLFILAMYLSKEAAMGNVPNDGPLPALLIPPSRRLQ
uniref:EH domain-containing protein n=1 Tax=Arcella intermedia TaxID=1963864 RepID=A0A6B2L2R4_9EUKA